MGKICPQCNYHFPEGESYYSPFTGCQHEFVLEYQDNPITNSNPKTTTTKWRCRKCLEVRYTND